MFTIFTKQPIRIMSMGKFGVNKVYWIDRNLRSSPNVEQKLVFHTTGKHTIKKCYFTSTSLTHQSQS